MCHAQGPQCSRCQFITHLQLFTRADTATEENLVICEPAHVAIPLQLLDRARKLYTSACIYEWKFGKGEWKMPFASPTGRVDFFWFCNYF